MNRRTRALQFDAKTRRKILDRDNGAKGLRPDMLAYIEKYMSRMYPGWDPKELVYKKYGCN